jgi:2-phosphoglycerate kinase
MENNNEDQFIKDLEDVLRRACDEGLQLLVETLIPQLAKYNIIINKNVCDRSYNFHYYKDGK